MELASEPNLPTWSLCSSPVGPPESLAFGDEYLAAKIGRCKIFGHWPLEYFLAICIFCLFFDFFWEGLGQLLSQGVSSGLYPPTWSYRELASPPVLMNLAEGNFLVGQGLDTAGSRCVGSLCQLTELTDQAHAQAEELSAERKHLETEMV